MRKSGNSRVDDSTSFVSEPGASTKFMDACESTTSNRIVRPKVIKRKRPKNGSRHWS
jgi:hypothetical protein